MLRIVDRKQFWAGFVFLGIGVIALTNLPADIGTATAMGPGYFPMLLGACLVLFGGLGMILSMRPGEVVPIGPVPLLPIAFVLGGILLFAVLINHVGLAGALAGLVASSCCGHLRRHPLEVLLVYLVLLALTWLIFIYAIQLPIDVF